MSVICVLQADQYELVLGHGLKPMSCPLFASVKLDSPECS